MVVEEEWHSSTGESIKATTVDVGDYTDFESLSVRLVGRSSRSVVVFCVYKPPGPVSSTFIDQLSDLFKAKQSKDV